MNEDLGGHFRLSTVEVNSEVASQTFIRIEFAVVEPYQAL